jgi:hypothetical protein
MGGGAIIQKRDYYFKIDGKEREVIEASAEYLELLKQMVADYRAAKI